MSILNQYHDPSYVDLLLTTKPVTEFDDTEMLLDPEYDADPEEVSLLLGNDFPKIRD